jgi:transcriptional regulator with XRE-family HTH domain
MGESLTDHNIHDGPPSWTLAQKINHLFDTIRRPDGTRYSNDEVAAAMGRGEPGRISGSYLWLLRRGDRDNPTIKHLEALATFFDVSPAYFFDDAKSRAIASELALLRAMKDSDVRRIAARLQGLSPRGMNAIANIIESVRAAEGLAPSPPDDDGPTERPSPPA